MLSLLVIMAASSFAVPAWASPPDDCADALRGARELETAGRLLAARARLADCMTGAGAGASHQECAARIVELDAAIPMVTLVVKDGEGHDLWNAQVSVDGKPLVHQPEGDSISVDPGEHHFLFQAAGFSPIETARVALAGQHNLRVMVFLHRDDPRSATAVANEPSLALPAMSTPASPGEATPGGAPPRWQKKVGGVLVGAAAGSLVVGAVWALLAKAKYDHALIVECGGDPHLCSPQGIAEGRTAHNEAFVATAGFVGAATFLAGAAVVYLAWPTTGQERITVAPVVSSTSAGVALTW
jgi:hypothetical protein